MPRWEQIRDDLSDPVLAVSPPFTKKQQEETVRTTQERGHTMVWNAIRKWDHVREAGSAGF